MLGQDLNIFNYIYLPDSFLLVIHSQPSILPQ
jgi:hypothetical protein